MASNAFQNAVGVQGQGLQGTPQVQITQAQVPDFERSLSVLGATIKESVKKIKGSERILEYTNMKTETAALDKEYEMVAPTLSSRGTVIDLEGNEVDYKEYTQSYTKRKQDLLQNFDTKYNDPFLFRDDQLWVSSKSELQTLPRQQEVNNLMLERNRLELKVSEDLGKISASPNLSFKEKVTAGLASLKAAPISERDRVERSETFILNAVESSVREFELYKQSVFTKLSEQYAEDEQGKAEALLQFSRSDEYRNRLQDVHFDIMDAQEFDARLEDELEEVKAKLQIEDFRTSEQLVSNRAEFQIRKAQEQRKVLLSETNEVAQILMNNPQDPLAAQHIVALEASKKNATDAEKVVIQDEIDFLKASKQAFTGMNGSFLNVKADGIKNVKLKSFVLRQQDIERNALEAERKAAENKRSTAEDALWYSLSEKGSADKAVIARSIAKGVPLETINKYINDTGAMSVDEEEAAIAIRTMSPKEAMQAIGNVQSGSKGEVALKKVVASTFGLNQSLVNAIFQSSSNPEQALAFSKAYGETGDRLTYKQDRDKASLVYNNETITLPNIPLQSNTMLLSNGQLYKMMASMEIQANPTKSLKELSSGINKRVNDFIQGAVNKQKEIAQQAKTFNPATIVKLNPNAFKNFYILQGKEKLPSTDFNYQNAADVAVLRKLDKQLGASGLGNTGLVVTSMFRRNYSGGRHVRKNEFAIDVQSRNTNPKVLGMQLYELFNTQASISNGNPYMIAGHAGGQGGKLFEVASIIKKTGAIPSDYVGTMSADKVRFIVNHVKRAEFLDEGSDADPHLHLSGVPDRVNTSKAYNNR